MVTKFSNKITLLTQTSKLLVIGTLTNSQNQLIDTYFQQKEYIDFNENSIELLNDNLYKQYDVVVFSLNQTDFELFKNSCNYFPKHSIVLINSSEYINMIDYINSIFSLLVLPIQDELLMDTIYNVLCVDETNKIIKSKEKIVKKYKDDEVNDNISEFLDKYHGTILFINEDLNANYNRLNDLEISKELFSDISTNILKLNNILQKHKSFDKLSKTFNQLSSFLMSLDLESIEPANYSAFDYLSTIIDDITIYLDELFVYKLFMDLHVFEDSLENNIHFFEDSLKNEVNEDDDNLEFF